MIRNLLFDFGNVLFDLDLDRIPRQMEQLWGDDYLTTMQWLRQHRILETYETGGLSTGEFVETLRHAGKKVLSAGQVVGVWNSIFLEMPASRFDLLLRLRQHYGVFLLSNINDLHARWITEYMERRHGIHDFESTYFDGVYYSHLIRLRKPDRDVYEYVLADAEIKPHETLFFDDLEINIVAARQSGIEAVLHTPGTDIATRCRDMGLGAV